jgi:TetR/AcrR family transcriptional repressor of mexJK operon
MSRKTPIASNPAARSRGRPKDPDKRAAILEAAKHLFARHGLTGVSMDVIAKAADVSKLTLYSHFRSKEDLFQQAVAEKCQEHTPSRFFDARTPQPLRDRLLRIGHGFVELIMSQEAMDLHRMMAAQAGGGQRLGKLFFAAGPERTLVQFSGLLKAASDAGELQVGDTRRAASHFFCLLKGIEHLRVMVGASGPPTARQQELHVRDVVEVFLRAYAARR